MRSWIVLAAGFALLLGACHVPAPANDTTPDAGAEMDRATKLQAYAAIMTSSDSLGGFDPERDLHAYEAHDIPRADPAEKVTFVPAILDRTLSDLKRAHAEPGRLPEVDAAAARAIPALDKLLVRLRGLDSYYTTRGPLADGFARGRREHPLLIADYRDAIPAWKGLKTAYEAARDADLVRSAAFYQREGRTAEYYDVAMVQKATALVRTIDSAQAATDPAKAAKADAIVTELLALVQRGRAERGQADRKDPDGAAMRDNGVPENIERMIGAWRDLQRTPDADHHAAMVEPYAAAMQTVTL